MVCLGCSFYVDATDCSQILVCLSHSHVDNVARVKDKVMLQGLAT